MTRNSERRNGSKTPASKGKKSIMLAMIMLFSIITPLGLPSISAHDAAETYSAWPKEGSNDTGWVMLNATGADPATGANAITDWMLEFAPGAQLSNLTFEVQVNGSNGTSILEPKLFDTSSSSVLFDWQGHGEFGAASNFNTGNTYSGRLAPNTDSGAVWTLPSAAEIDNLAFEALAPVDPIVSFSPLNLNITAQAIHPVDGRLYLAIGDSILLLDSNSNPKVIDLVTIENVEITDLEIDLNGNRILVVTQSGARAFSLLDGSDLGLLPDNPITANNGETIPFDEMLAINGDVWATSINGLFKLNSAGTSWTQERIAGTTNWPNGIPMAMGELNGILYVSIADAGVARWETSTNVALSTWSTANNLNSDRINQFLFTSTTILFASDDGGVGRYNYQNSYWLASWNSGNWLASDNIRGMVEAQNEIVILAGDTTQIYDTSIGAFTTSNQISTYDLVRSGEDLVAWPAGGSRAPATTQALVSDGSGTLAILEPASSTLFASSLLLASGPSGNNMHDVEQVGQITWVAIGENLDRFDMTSYQWLEPIALGNEVVGLTSLGNTIWAATTGGGLIEIDASTGMINWTIMAADGLNSDDVSAVAVDSLGDNIVVIHPRDGVSVLAKQNGMFSVTSTWNDNDGLGTNFMRDVTILGDTTYIATDGDGVARINLTSGTLLTPWTSTGVDNVNYAPVLVAGNVLLMGLYGHGIVRKNLQTGEFLQTWDAAGTGLTNNNIISLHLDVNGNIWIGTENGLFQWDGSNFNSVNVGGGGWNSPRQFYSLDSTATEIYAGTNAGVCEFDISTRQRGDCWNTGDGMPYNYVRSVAVNGNTVLGGTWLGVGLINITTGNVDGTWEAGGSTGNAVVEVIGSIAYIALDGEGIARLDLNTGGWLTSWTDGSGGLLDTDGITSMAAGLQPDHLWIGGDDGFQLLDIVNETELYDIEKSSNLFSGNGDPIEIVIAGNVLYYIAPYNYGDNVHRIDIQNYSSMSSLDAGAQVGITGYVYGIGLVNNVLNIGVSEWNDGDGAVARYDAINMQWTTTWEATGSVERVTTYESPTTGHYWVAWGEVKLEEIAANGTVLNTWDSGIEWPIREILEYDGELLFASADGVMRYDENTSQWLSTWTSGNGLPSNAEDEVFDLFVNGTDLWVGTSGSSWWGGLQNPRISLLDGSGSWSTWNGGQGNIPNGYPISFSQCNGIIHVAMSSVPNGGVARYDGTTWITSFATSSGLSDDNPVSVVCDDQDTLYIGYYDEGFGIDRYSYPRALWLSNLDNVNSGISDSGLWWDSISWNNGQLAIGHRLSNNGNNNGGVSVISARGANFGQGSVFNQGSSVSDVDVMSQGLVISTAGSSSGYSHIDTLNQFGLNVFLALPGLVNGRVSEIVGNSTHVWVVTSDSQGNGQGVLQGQLLPNGSVEWQFGWSAWGGSIKEIALVGDMIYATIAGRGLARLNTITGNSNLLPQGLHNDLDGLAVYGNELVVGLQGTWASAAGVQVWDTTTSQWTMGRLLSGLPNNIINDFAITSTHVLIATEGGLGQWNLSKSDWDDPLTNADGLSSNNIMTLDVLGCSIFMGTPIGLSGWDECTNSALPLLQRANGLVGDSTVSTYLVQTQQATTLFAAHNGAGSTRPGVAEIDMAVSSVTTPNGTYNTYSPSVVNTHRPDQIPHNTVTALASDWWGVHIATVSEPLTHWNASSNQFEDGAASWQIPSWPIYDMDSDGINLVVASNDGGARIDATSMTHTVYAQYRTENTVAASISSVGLWLATQDGLMGWGPAPTFTQRDEFSMRRASPLNVGIAGTYRNITSFTHPGAVISLANSTNTISLEPSLGVAGPGGIKMLDSALSLSSPVDGAAVWVRSVGLTYSGIWDLNETNQNFANTFQSIVDYSPTQNGSRRVILRLQSPENGSMMVRATYDWVRSETPIQMVALWDRADDGGGTLVANWSLVHDETFSRYLVFAMPSPWINPPTTGVDIMGLQPDAQISLHSRLQAEIFTAGGQPLIDGVDYDALVVVEYSDGTYGTPSLLMGPASPSNEIPEPPAWGAAEPDDGGERGALYVEWARCSALDLAHTNIYVSDTMISDALALTVEATVGASDGNTTTLQLRPGKPYWLALTCVDEAGQENLSNALIIGPVVPTGGVNDGVPPPRIEGVWADDVPEDEGGRIQVGWDVSVAEDCSFYTIYMMEKGDEQDSPQDPTNVDEFIAVAVVSGCDENYTIISSYNDETLTDGQPYWIGVVASDDWLNEDKGNVNIVTATPYNNLIDSSQAPDRISSIEAWDHPDDEGTAIDVRFMPSQADDFAFYVIWVGAQNMSNVESTWNSYGPDSSRCGCVKITKQWIGDESSPLELTLHQAMYTGDGDALDPTDLIMNIMPDVELEVSVTVHDIKGNVHLTDLQTASVTPIDNSQDNTAPGRISNILLYDFPMDDGTRLLLEFARSEASDIDHYEVYADIRPFNDVGEGTNGPQDPILIIDRSHEQAILIDSLLRGEAIIPNVEVTVAVVAVDSSDNAHRTGLLTASASSIDDGISDPGAYLPDILGISVEWNEDGSEIEVNWEHSTDPRVETYRVFIGEEEFKASGEVEDAILAGIVRASNSYIINANNFNEFNNDSTWWIGVSAGDDLTFRHSIDLTELAPYIPPSADGTGGGDSTAEEEKGALDQILEPTNMLIVSLLLAILLILVLLFKGNSSRSRRDSVWELQEATWGIPGQYDSGWDSDLDPMMKQAPQLPVAPPTQQPPTQQAPNTGHFNQHIDSSAIYGAAQNIQQQSTQPAPAQQQSFQQPTQQAYDSKPKSNVNSEIDTSFLDDLL